MSKDKGDGVTVKELRDMLEDHDDDDRVFFAYPSNDYWRTMIAEPVQEVETLPLVPSDYHGEGIFKITKDDPEDDSDDPSFVVISSRRNLLF